MKRLLDEAFTDAALTGPPVQKGHFDLLIGNDTVLPSLWSASIKPGTKVRMLMVCNSRFCLFLFLASPKSPKARFGRTKRSPPVPSCLIATHYGNAYPKSCSGPWRECSFLVKPGRRTPVWHNGALVHRRD